MMMTKRIYFPELDGLRLFAFLLVLIHHSPPVSQQMDSGTFLYQLLSQLKVHGWLGVELFLVLSSFLISTLLLKEMAATSQVSVRRFYMRRILRIWPLYLPYLWATMIFVAVLSPLIFHEPLKLEILKDHLLPFTFFLGNVSYSNFTETLSPLFAHLWTICLEEQFYFTIPFIIPIAFSRGRQVSRWLLGLIFLSIISRWLTVYFARPYPEIWVLPYNRLDPFCWGLLAALLLHFKPKIFEKIKGWWTFVLGASVWFVVMRGPPLATSNEAVWQLTLASIGALFFMIGAINTPKFADFFSNEWLRNIGKLSFGLYVWHEIVILAYQKSDLDQTLPRGILGWTLSIIIHFSFCYILAWLSYRFYESKFLKFKSRFEVIPSRPD